MNNGLIETIAFAVCSVFLLFTAIQRIWMTIQLTRSQNSLLKAIMRLKEVERVNVQEAISAEQPKVEYATRMETLLAYVYNQQVLQTYFSGYYVIYITVILNIACTLTMFLLLFNNETRYYYGFTVGFVAWLMAGHACKSVRNIIQKVEINSNLYSLNEDGITH